MSSEQFTCVDCGTLELLLDSTLRAAGLETTKAAILRQTDCGLALPSIGIR